MPGSPSRRNDRRLAASLAGLALVAVASLAAPAASSAQSGAPREATRLEQNVPNPFTPGFSQTIIAYRLERRGRVRLTVYNRLAQEVAVLVDRTEDPGRYVVSWEGTGENGEPVPQGIYWYDLQLDGQRIALRQMRVLESGAPEESEAWPAVGDEAPLAGGVESPSDRSASRGWGLGAWSRHGGDGAGPPVSGSRTAGDRSFRTSSGMPR